MELNFIFYFAVLIMSIVIHEVSHGYAALFLGDRTALYEGRLTLNPLKHIDMVGSLIVPLLSFTLGGIIFGWAKPVPFNPYNFTKMRERGEALVAFAGPLSNLVIALIFGLFMRFSSLDVESPAFKLSALIVLINLILALFNLMPIPPLDGSKILPRFLPFSLRMKYENFRRFFEQNIALGFALVIILFMTVFAGPVYAASRFLTILLIG
jgi:Zn-dependent protease